MFGFMIGFLLGALVMFLLRGPSPHKGSHRMAPRKKVDGIWTVRDHRVKKPVDPNRPRVRRALILERSRRG